MLSEEGEKLMKEITIIQEFQKHAAAINNLQTVVNAQTTKIVGLEARLRCYEDMSLRWGGVLWVIIRNIFWPKSVVADLSARFKDYAKAYAPKAEPKPEQKPEPEAVGAKCE